MNINNIYVYYLANGCEGSSLPFGLLIGSTAPLIVRPIFSVVI